MKKVLFLIGAIDSGGVSKSLLNTLNAFDRTHYDVHLMVMSGQMGDFSVYLPEDIKVHTIIGAELALNGWQGVLGYIGRLQLRCALLSIVRMFVSLFDKSMAAWLLSRLFPPLEESFDMIVDYNGQQQLYYMVDKLRARKKVTFFHSNYAQWPYYKNMDKRYFPKVDAVFTICKQCVESLKTFFPEVRDKIHLFENITSPEIIEQLAQESVDRSKFKGKIFVTIGHVWYNKGIDLAIGAASILKRKGVVFTWLFLGKVAEPKWIDAVRSKNLQEEMLFLGVKSNPYPYLKMADVVVHPSRFEGKSITLDEAKLLCKPIVVTDFSTVHDQFLDGKNATICEMRGESIARAIVELLSNENLRDKYVNRLKLHKVDNSIEVKKLYKILEVDA